METNDGRIYFLEIFGDKPIETLNDVANLWAYMVAVANDNPGYLPVFTLENNGEV